MSTEVNAGTMKHKQSRSAVFASGDLSAEYAYSCPYRVSSNSSIVYSSRTRDHEWTGILMTVPLVNDHSALYGAVYTLLRRSRKLIRGACMGNVGGCPGRWESEKQPKKWATDSRENCSFAYGRKCLAVFSIVMTTAFAQNT
jgi:hypothetical protein